MAEDGVPYFVAIRWQAQGLLEAISSNYHIVDAVAALMPCLASSHECASFIGKQSMKMSDHPPRKNRQPVPRHSLVKSLSGIVKTFSSSRSLWWFVWVHALTSFQMPLFLPSTCWILLVALPPDSNLDHRQKFTLRFVIGGAWGAMMGLPSGGPF